jgi:F-type H+-transporting ATPase subunit a|tara:strand:+ start:5897 stop:6664 length:768 start_codon:yes stop_codon:yes gene_type:complete
MLLTPLEQFQIISFWSVKMLCLDFSLTNMLFVNVLVLFLLSSIILFFSSVNNGTVSFFLVPNIWQLLLETVYEVVGQLVFDNLNEEGEKYFPFITVIFTFILFNNLIGLVPYSFTITSHLIVTFILSFSIFIGAVIICVGKHKAQMFSIFLPANTSFGLALLLVPIELISYVFKPISLGVRLFANLMAGHTLLKVIVGFAWSMLVLENFISFMHLIPLLVLVILMGLELGVAVIQAYVFTVLMCIYLNESINIAH